MMEEETGGEGVLAQLILIMQILIPSFKGLVSSDTQPPPVSGRLEEGLSLGPVCRCAGDLLPVLQVRARRPEVRSARRRPPIGRLRLPPAASKAELWL
ncbi:unnamed protein product [Arctogadus glacialis]